MTESVLSRVRTLFLGKKAGRKRLKVSSGEELQAGKGNLLAFEFFLRVDLPYSGDEIA